MGPKRWYWRRTTHSFCTIFTKEKSYHEIHVSTGPEEVGWAGVYVDLESINYSTIEWILRLSLTSQQKRRWSCAILGSLGASVDSNHQNQNHPKWTSKTSNFGPVLRRHSHNLFARAARETSKAKPTNWWPSMGSRPDVRAKPWLGWLGWVVREHSGKTRIFFFGGGGAGLFETTSGVVHQTQDWKRRRISFCNIVKMPMPQVSWHKFTQLWVCWQEISWREPGLQTMNVPVFEKHSFKIPKGGDE